MAKRTASANGKYARAKGLQFERDVVNMLKHIFPKARRLLECQEGMGYDIENAGPLRIQCKNYAKYAPITKIDEVPRSSDTIPVLVTKGSRLEPMAVLPLKDFISMLDEIAGAKVKRAEWQNIGGYNG